MIISDIVTNKNIDPVEEKGIAVEKLTKTISSKPYKPFQNDINKEKNHTKRAMVLWVVFMTMCIGIAVYVWHIFAYAKVTIETQHVPYAFTNTPFTGFRKNDSTQDTGVPFEIMVIEDTYKQTVYYGNKNIDKKKARGSILVQNSATSQKLTLKKGSVAISNTGMHYIVLNTATIPGYTKKGTVITPGSTEVVIEAEKVGFEYNITGGNFTFPNYKSKSNLLTAKTIGLGIVGGANGNVYTMTDDEVNTITKDIQDSAKNKIFIKANAEIPPGYRIYKNAVVYKSSPIDNLKESPTAVRDVSQDTTLTAYLFRDRDIENFIFTHSEHTLQEPSYIVSDIDKSDIVLVNTPTDPKNTTTLDLQFTGTGIITWTVDEIALQKALVGVKKNSVNTIFSGFKTIDTVTVKTNPWFEQTLPTNPARIHMDILN